MRKRIPFRVYKGRSCIPPECYKYLFGADKPPDKPQFRIAGFVVLAFVIGVLAAVYLNT